jgi:hypothetical protein
MPVPRKLLRSALVDLHHDETIMNDKRLTLEAIRKLICTRFNFNAGIDFAVRELKKAANEVGPLGSKISQGNHAIVRSSGATEIFRHRCHKKSECEPVNAVFLLDGSISVPATRGINGACLQAVQPAYTDILARNRKLTMAAIEPEQEAVLAVVYGLSVNQNN